METNGRLVWHEDNTTIAVKRPVHVKCIDLYVRDISSRVLNWGRGRKEGFLRAERTPANLAAWSLLAAGAGAGEAAQRSKLAAANGTPAFRGTVYLFGGLFLFHTVTNYNIHYFSAKPLHNALKATLFAWKINKEEFSWIFTWLAACSSSRPSPTTTYVMLAPNLDTIRSKQLSFPGKTTHCLTFSIRTGFKLEEMGFSQMEWQQ